MRPPKNSASGGIPSEPEKYDVLRGILPLWDMSSNPANNAKLADKLGKADHIRGGAIVALDKDSNRNTIADGILNKRKIPSIMQMDPDSWVLRLRKVGTAGYQGSWMVRLCVDHSEPDSSLDNRGTMVIDQNREQQWAWLTDALRMTAPQGGTFVSDKEIMFTDAGYLSNLYEKQTTPTRARRGALAYNVARNGGFISDGAGIGQLSHVLCFPSPGTPTPGSGKRRSNTDGPPPRINIPKPEKTEELLLRGDAGIRFIEGIGRFVIVKQEGEAPTSSPADETRVVEMCLAEEAPADTPLFDPVQDKNSNHQTITKDARKQKLRGWVKVPRGGNTCNHYDYSYHSPPPWEGSSGSSGSSGASSGSDVSIGTGSGGSMPPNGGTNPDGLPAAGEPVPTVDTGPAPNNTSSALYGYDGGN